MSCLVTVCGSILSPTFYKMSKNMVQRTNDRDLPNVPSLHFRHRNTA